MIKKFLAFGLLIVITLWATMPIYATDNKIYTLTDGENDLAYTISENSRGISVSLDGEVMGNTYVKDVDAYSLYDGILHIFTVDNINSSLGVYRFDIHNDSIESYAVSAKAFDSKYCFAADKDGSVYFASDDDTSTLCVYKNGNLNTISLNFQIKQILCIDGENVLLFTENCVCNYFDGKTAVILSTPLFTPVTYSGEGVLREPSGKIYSYDSGRIFEATPYVTESNTINTHPDIQNNIYTADIGITVSKIKKALADLEISKLAKADGTVIKSGKLGTGATAELASGEIITIIISGELTGEGNINSRDLKAILNHLSEKELLADSALIAADIDKDGEITTKDALKISLMY